MTEIGPTLPDHAARTPDKPALIMAESGETTTYAELEERSNRYAQLFRALGLRTGDHIALYLENTPRYHEICWAAKRSGLFFTCISSYLTAPEVDYIVGDCGAKLFISSAYKQDVAAEMLDLMPGVAHRFMIDGAIDGYDSMEAAAAGMPATRIADEAEGLDMLYSSGTTGRPKAIRRFHQGVPFGTIDPAIEAIGGLFEVTEDTVYLSPAPLYHAAPLRFNLRIQLAGGTTVVMRRFDPAFALELIERHRITHSQWVPTMFVRMLKLPEEARTRFDLASHRIAIHAAAPCPVPVKQQMIEWWGPILREYYAGSESNGFCHIDSHEWLAHPGSVGRPLFGVPRIVGEDGEELPTGEEGTIYFSDGHAFEYHNDPERTAAAYNDRGWSTLGDVGYLDGEGFLYLTDRKAFMIISGGVNIYPQEIENVLITHPKVADVAVFGVPNDEFGEEVKAVVQADGHGRGICRWGRRARRRTARPRAGGTERRQGAAEHRLRGRTAPPRHRQALQAPLERPLLGQKGQPDRLGGPRLDAFADFLAGFGLRDAQVIGGLQVHPELCGGAEVARQPQRCVRRHAAALAHDIVDPRGVDRKRAGQCVGAERQGLQKILAQDFAGVCANTGHRSCPATPARRSISESNRSASHILITDWRVTPRRAASRSSAATIHSGKSTFTRLGDWLIR